MEKQLQKGLPGLVSIVIPIYNAEEKLQRALASVLVQDYPHWEAVLVDDGSTDGSYALALSYVQRDARFRVLHQENSGQAAARNRALDIARGEYVAFLDADDEWLVADALTFMVDTLVATGADLMRMGMWVDYGEFKEAATLHEDTDDEVYIFEELLTNRLDSSIGAYFFRAWLWRDLRFTEGKIAEDFIILPELMAKAEKTVLRKRLLYHCFRQDEVATSRSAKGVLLQVTLEMLQERIAKVEEEIWPVRLGVAKEIRGVLAGYCLNLERSRTVGVRYEGLNYAGVRDWLWRYGGDLRRASDRQRYWAWEHAYWLFAVRTYVDWFIFRLGKGRKKGEKAW